MSFVTGHVSPVTFNIDGQPIGDNAASLSTMIGRSVKNNILPSFDKWSNMPDVMKEKVWDIVTVSNCAFGSSSFHILFTFFG